MRARTFLPACLVVLAAFYMVSNAQAGGTLTWLTRLGSDTALTTNRQVAVAPSGNIYFVGGSIESFGSPLASHSGSYDLLLAKFNSDGILQWHTFIGSAAWDEGYDIVLDASENVFVAGYSFDNFGSPVNPHAGARPMDPLNSDILVAKFNSSGALLWHTFHGIGQENIFGGENDRGNGIDLDASGNVYVTGFSDGSWGSPLAPFVNQNVRQVVALKLNSTGVLQWNTFYGSGDGSSQGWAVEADDSGNSFVVGISSDTWGSPRAPFSGPLSNAQLFKLSTNGALLWNTFSSGAGGANSVALDDDGNIYITAGAQVPWAGPAVNPHNNSGTDIAVAKYGETGHQIWQTFLGASDGQDIGTNIVLRGVNLYVTATSAYSWGTPVDPKASPDETFCSVAMELGDTGSLVHQSFQCGEAGINGSLGWFNLNRNISGAMNPALQPIIGGIANEAWGTPIADFTGSGAFLAQLDFPVRPEIQVEGNGLDIENGDTSPDPSDGTDFGGTAVDVGTVLGPFTIRNLGTGPLQLNGTPLVEISGTHSADFTVSMLPSTPVAADSSTTFEVTFDPSAEGLRTATVNIPSDDEDESPFTFDIQGTGLPPGPEIAVLGNGIEIPDGTTATTAEQGTLFPPTAVNGFTRQEFVIQNNGTLNLELTGDPLIQLSGANLFDWDVVQEPDTTILPGGESSFELRFNPMDTGVRVAQVSIENNDSDEDPYTFNIEGTAEPGFTVGGSIINLQGMDLALDSGYGQQTVIPFPGLTEFTFSLPVIDGTAYDVTVANQPTNPDQVCTVSNGIGVIDGADVTDVVLTCGTGFTVGGTVTGLVGASMTLANNCTDILEVTDNGPFAFTMGLDDGDPYSVTIDSQPGSPPQICVVNNGSGTIPGASVSNVEVICGDQQVFLQNGFESPAATCP